MTRRPCSNNCSYYVEGRCRLKERPIERNPFCPYYEGQYLSRGMI